MGRPNSGLKRQTQAHCHRAKKTPISIRYRPGVKTYIYTGRGGWVKKRCNDSDRDETSESNCRAKSSVHALLMVHCLPPWPCLCTKSMPIHETMVFLSPCLKPLKRVMRYAIYNTTNPQFYCGEELLPTLVRSLIAKAPTLAVSCFYPMNELRRLTQYLAS